MRNRTLIVGLLGVPLVTGCYVLQPVAGTAPVEGKLVAFDVSDAGRVALGGSMGPSIAQIEGRLLGRESDAYVVSVSSVRYLSGGNQTWSGETIRLQPGHIAVTYERRLSKARTVAAVALGVGAAAFIATRSVNGGGVEPGRPTPGDSIGGTTSRGRRP